MAEQRTWSRFLLGCLVWAVCSSFCSLARAETIEQARTVFKTELERLAQVCDRVQLSDEAEITRRWLPPQRSDQTTLFLSSARLNTVSGESASAHWQRHFITARKKYAASLFAEAKRVAASDEPKAYRLLWQTLREDPEHSDAKAALGNLVANAGATPRVRSGAAALSDLGWQPRSYLTIRTPHFDVVSRGDRAQTRALATKLEKLFILWTQVFYSSWAKDGKLATALAQQDVPRLNWPHRNRFKVAMLSGREEYLQLLGASEESIGVSVGYYSPEGKQAIFYAGDDFSVTLVHELTHQFFAEGSHRTSSTVPGASHSYWLIEGIAMYMESLSDRGSYWTVGGWESERLQTARYRGVRDGYWLPLPRIAASTLESWKRDEQVALLYTHAAGLTHVLMDNRLAAPTRELTIQTLGKLYAGDGDTTELLDQFGISDEAAKVAYQDALIVSGSDVLASVDSNYLPKQLVLSGTQLSKDSWRKLAGQTALTWLDLAFSNIDNDSVRQWVQAATKLKRLSLEGTSADAAVVLAAAKLPNLVELDLSDCNITDADLDALRGHPTLSTIWLTRTQVTDQALAILRTIPNLNSVDASGTKANPANWSAWQ
ncbi:MAG: hypothetical protein Aurels2KO_41790 [Aureliella sp.]